MSNASRLVDKLKEKGLVERQECSTDRRRVDIVITPAGIDIVQRAREAVDLKLQETFASLTEEEATQLNLLLDKLRG